MGKRSRADETEAERKERKRRKKEKKRKQDAEGNKRDSVESTLSTPEAKDIPVDANSAVFFDQRIELTVSLLPADLRNVQQRVEDAIRGFLLKFSDEVGGIMLSFDHVVILNDGKGEIINELPHIHFRVACNALVFRPSVGRRLTGVVTESSFHSHVSLVMYNYFNASVPEDQLRSAGMEFDDSSQAWYTGTQTLEQGHKLDFTVKKIFESGGIISIDGEQPTFRAEGK